MKNNNKTEIIDISTISTILLETQWGWANLRPHLQNTSTWCYNKTFNKWK